MMSAKSAASLTVFTKFDEGNFGEIFLVRKNGGHDDAKIYAMKTIGANGANEEQHKICRNELKMLKLVRGAPFIIQLKYAFKTRYTYNYVMDYMASGNLFDFFQSGCLTLTETTHCCAELVTAIQYLHEQRIVFRDLKLENILISGDNHILITDFGLARKIQDGERLTDEAGTVAYFAPESLNSKTGHSFEVDWWSLGIIAYELLVGHTPFVSSSSEAVKDRQLRIRIEKEQPRLAKLLSYGPNHAIVCDLITKLLIKDPEKRLGAGQTGYKAVKQHPFFSRLNWRAVKLKLYKCLEPRAIARNVEISYIDQYNISLEEPTEKRRKQFYFIAPELQGRKMEPFHGFEEEYNSMLAKNRDDRSAYEIQLTQNLFIKTTEPAEFIKQMILPKKVVRFAEPSVIIENSMRPITWKQSKKDQRQKPYPTSTDTNEKPRRSERVSAKRTIRSNSLS